MWCAGCCPWCNNYESDWYHWCCLALLVAVFHWCTALLPSVMATLADWLACHTDITKHISIWRRFVCRSHVFYWSYRRSNCSRPYPHRTKCAQSQFGGSDATATGGGGGGGSTWRGIKSWRNTTRHHRDCCCHCFCFFCRKDLKHCLLFALLFRWLMTAQRWLQCATDWLPVCTIIIITIIFTTTTSCTLVLLFSANVSAISAASAAVLSSNVFMALK